MTALSNTAERIIVAAERRIRGSGFHGFSFREIAADVGIKSASVHHHFPTKEDLVAAVARAYTDRHMAALGDPADPKRGPADLVALYIDVFHRDLVEHRKICPCGILATEASTLGSLINAEVREFFMRNQLWLETVLARTAPGTLLQESRAKAQLIIATIEGALLLANSVGDTEVFENIALELSSTLPASLAEMT